MKKLLNLSLIGILFSINLSANEGLSLGKLKKIPLNLDFLSTENGGNKSAIDAYSDGVGIYIIGLEDKKFSAMNELVFKYGEEAKKSGETLKEHVLDKGNNKEQELASLLGPNTGGGSVIGEFCDDGDLNTENDRYTDTNGTCQGNAIVVKNSIKCEGDEIGSDFLVDGIRYLVVNNDSIWDNIDRAETLCTSNVTNMSYLFSDIESSYGNFNGDISSWDTSNVTDMSYMFGTNKYFNGDISSWDTSNVVDMEGMFAYSNFNMDISNWDTSKVLNFTNMFKGANSFNQPLNNWNVSSAVYMEGMFLQAQSFNQPLNKWNVSSAVYMESMFDQAESFNQPLNSWNTSNVIDMDFMFFQAESFNQPLNSWNTSNVIDMAGMFEQANSFNQPLNSWNTSNVIYMSGMFYEAYNFNQDISKWDVNNVLHYSDFSSGSGLVYSYRPLFN